MADDNKTLRLNKVLRELNISLDRAVEHLTSQGFEIEARPTTKISNDEYEILLDGFQTDRNKKAASKEVGEEKRKEKEALRVALEDKQEKQRLEEDAKRVVVKAKADKLEFKTVGKIDIEPRKTVSEPAVEKPAPTPVVEEVKVETPKEEVATPPAPVQEVPVVKETPIKEVQVAKTEEKPVEVVAEKVIEKVDEKPTIVEAKKTEVPVAPKEVTKPEFKK